MANQTIGKLVHHCGQSADVRKNKNSKLYLSCPNCGLLAYALTGGQNYILDNAVMLDERGNMPAAKPEKKAVKEKPLRNVESNSRYEREVLAKPEGKAVTEKPVKEKPLVKDGGIGSMKL